MAAGKHDYGQDQRDGGRGKARGQRDLHRRGEAGRDEQTTPGLERKLLAPEHRQVAEGRQQRADQPGDDRSEEQADRESGQIAKQGGRISC